MDTTSGDNTPGREPVPVRLGPDDLGELVQLERCCFTCPWTEEQFRLGLERGVFKIFGLKQDGRLVAYLSVYHVGEEMEILNLAVHPEHRRRGLGRRLLGLVLKSCYKMSVAESFLEVRRSNTAALALYRQFGFEITGERKNYYPDNGEDALLMKCDLISLFGKEPDK